VRANPRRAPAAEVDEDAAWDCVEDVALPELPRLGTHSKRWVAASRAGGGGGESGGEGEDGGGRAAGKPLGSNHAVPCGQSLAYRLSAGALVGCGCCQEAYAATWLCGASTRRLV
jgi:hypothetical protein